jgi:hypothetical protein
VQKRNGNGFSIEGWGQRLVNESLCDTHVTLYGAHVVVTRVSDRQVIVGLGKSLVSYFSDNENPFDSQKVHLTVKIIHHSPDNHVTLHSDSLHKTSQ